MQAAQGMKVATPGAAGAGRTWLAAAAMTIALYLWVVCWPIVAPDMTLFLFPWYQHIVASGPIAAFHTPFSNYTPPYLYLLDAVSLGGGVLSPLAALKLVALAGTVFLAAACADLIVALGGDRRRAVLIFALPTVIINAALLGQCDSLWAASCVLAIAAMIRARTATALLWCGVAIAFKAQSAFVAPFIVGALIGRRAPLWQWLIPPATYCMLMLPAWIAGWPAADLALIYVRQVEYFDFPGNLANPWIWMAAYAKGGQAYYIIGYGAAAAAAVAIAAVTARSVQRTRALLPLALLSATALPYMLPKMHERYLFLADVLAFALAAVQPSRKTVTAALAVQLTSLSALIAYIYNWRAPALAGALVGAAALLVIAGIVREELASRPSG